MTDLQKDVFHYTVELIIGLALLLAGAILQTLLDLNFAHKIVKKLSCKFFLNGQPDLRGEWGQYWEVKSNNFQDESNRYSPAMMWQMGKYCYAEFDANKKKYILFGNLRANYLVGHWYDADDKMGYLGTFELEVKDSQNLSGRWLGHSKVERKINTDDWVWKKS